tara:strand:- start:1322 stop:1639 length:318 start_codon:yes stop_codon:yes gene_type:complete
MKQEVNTKDINTLVNHLSAEQNKDFMFNIICNFLEERIGVSIVKTFTGNVTINFDFSVEQSGNVDDVKEQVTQQIQQALRSGRSRQSFYILSEQDVDFSNIESLN